MRFDKLTLKAQEALQEAQTFAERFKHSSVEVEHLLFALLSQSEGITRPLLEKLSVDSDNLRSQLQKELDGLPKVSGAVNDGGTIGTRLSKVFADAFAIAADLKDEYISTEHLLLATADEPGAA